MMNRNWIRSFATVPHSSEKIVKNVLHCRFLKNNTHLTLSSVYEDEKFLEKNAQLSYNDKMLYYLQLPERVTLRLSCGHLGFKKSARGEYEAAFQTASKMFELIQEKKLLQNLELDLKHFGKGREAFNDALLGKEGRVVRKLITKVWDSTSVKFGGVRAPAQRRL